MPARAARGSILFLRSCDSGGCVRACVSLWLYAGNRIVTLCREGHLETSFAVRDWRLAQGERHSWLQVVMSQLSGGSSPVSECA